MKNSHMLRNVISLTVIAFITVGCTTKVNISKPETNLGRYKVVKDYGPEALVDVSHVVDAVPKVEPRSRGGNSSQYEVLGKTYSVMQSSTNFKERGGASWYGKKFHGYLTANGEKYDMYGMTGAHKSLPIPTYVTVTNLSNNKQVIVRINDRGPFHEGRVIDLSYAAAAKLDMLDDGTAQVEVIAIDPQTWQAQAPITTPSIISNSHVVDDERAAITEFLKVAATRPKSGNDSEASEMVAKNNAVAAQKPQSKADMYQGIHYMQVGVYSSEEIAHAVTLKVNGFGLPVLISDVQQPKRMLYKVILGPMKSRLRTTEITQELADIGFPGAHLVDLPK